MKVRLGFVSNSSSSSYIISYDPEEINITGLVKYNNRYSEEESRVNYIGIKNVAEHLKSWYCIDTYEQDDSDVEQYKQEFAQWASYVAMMADEVSAGKEVAYITVPYSDDDTLERLRNIDGIKFVKDFG